MKSFKTKLDHFIDQISEESRERTRQGVERIVQNGVVSYQDWLALISNPEANLESRLTACWIIGQVGNGYALTALSHALQDQNPQIRGYAAGALANLRMGLKRVRNTKVIEAIIRTFQTDPDVNVRVQAGFALREFAEPRSLEPLLQVLNNRAEPASVRDVAAEALAYIPDARVIAPMTEALHDSEEVVRISAAYTLGSLAAAYDHGSLRGPEAFAELQRVVPHLIEALSDPSEKVRYWTVHALCDMRDPRALSELQRVADTDQGTWYGDGVAELARYAIQAIQGHDSD